MAQVPAFLEKALSFLPPLVEKLNTLFEEHKKLVMGVFGGLVALLCVLIGISFIRDAAIKHAAERRLEAQQTARQEAMIQALAEKPAIPLEDIFMPDEPDFLPAVILEKEARNWTAEDTREFWTNPLENDEPVWREAISGVVNTIMDRVR
jgi:hypothetical protein